MGGIQKKHAKARLDKYYYLAKEKGYRARAAFKLIQLNKRYHFLESSRCLIDLCAAPGSWLQVAAETMPQKSLIVGVDLAPIKPIPKAITFQGDITTEKCRATIRGYLKTMKADSVIHDGAPNVGTAWVQDAFSQNALVLSSLKLATEFLAPNGNFVTKVFRSRDSNKLEWIFKQLFARVEQTKPPSSRGVSAETFYVCRGFKAPKHLDPKFLDPKYAFTEIEDAKPNNEAKVFNPEKKKRKREGYEEGDWTQFHEESASSFIETQDPIAMLGSLNRLHFRQEGNGDIAQVALNKLPDTTEEVRLCCEDLKVLGRKEFKLLLRWRLKAREVFGMREKRSGHTKAGALEEKEANQAQTENEGVTVESMDDEMRLQQEIQALKDAQSKDKRKERRRENERKQKELTRLQMGMTTPHEIGIDAAENDPTFRIKDVDKAGIARQIAKGRMHVQLEPEKEEQQEEMEIDDEDDGDALEAQLDDMYEMYQEKKENRDAKARAKRIRQQSRTDHDDEFEGFSGSDGESNNGDQLVEDLDSGSDSEEDGESRLVDDLGLDGQMQDGLTRRAKNFFDQDIFGSLGLDEGAESETERERDSGIDVDSGSSVEDEKPAVGQTKSTQPNRVEAGQMFEDEDESDYEEVEAEEEEEDWDSGDERPAQESEGRPNIDIITAEAMTLAHSLARGEKTKHDLLDDNFNKFSHRDVDGLPEWFLDDEGKHSRIQRPTTKEAAQAIREKMRALNARPIKKVREAKARKTLRAARRLEKLKKKSEGLANDDGDMSERDKVGAIAKLMAKAKKGTKKQKQKVAVVVAGGSNKGAGRPRGVKGKYKMVDSRLKSDVRAEKRLAKAKKSNKRKRYN
ncbi:hypothetical protein K431DRAFT_286412 [Polychaeton citri CBS 116435]|uniref:AdoMet-dependent rRNA methyltransferase SPB1 n=1 Tax=Polychaeton citri CBS 116435 TaxID=1314669 RepID=A0A9P4UNU3_9PEZI|nr:hypothetical protein K431DRAFT_286412 [Polychaeton citri CBS 116435]